jgi:hypothetical protein
MAQAQTDNMMQMLDPFGIWKKTRDSMLDAWSKPMMEFAQSDAFVEAAGTLLEQTLGWAQPMQDTVQKSMAYTLAYLNMPTRDEIMSQAERLINIERRLDDLDAKTSDMRDEDRRDLRALERRLNRVEENITASIETTAKESRGVDRSLERMLNTLMARLDTLEAALTAARTDTGAPEPPAETEPEQKPPRKK